MASRKSRAVLAGAALATAALLSAGAEAGQDDYRVIVEKYAAEQGIPASLAHAVVMVESRYNARATGAGGVIGLMQIKHQTARGMGYAGSRDGLYDPDTNLRFGVKYLAGAYRLADGDVCGTILRYAGGHRATRMSAGVRSYCKKVQGYMASDPGVSVQQAALTRAEEEARQDPRVVRAERTAAAKAGKAAEARQAAKAQAERAAAAGKAVQDLARSIALAQQGLSADEAAASETALRVRADALSDAQKKDLRDAQRRAKREAQLAARAERAAQREERGAERAEAALKTQMQRAAIAAARAAEKARRAEQRQASLRQERAEAAAEQTGSVSEPEHAERAVAASGQPNLF